MIYYAAEFMHMRSVKKNAFMNYTFLWDNSYSMLLIYQRSSHIEKKIDTEEVIRPKCGMDGIILFDLTSEMINELRWKNY